MTAEHSPSCAWVETRLQPVRWLCNCRAQFAIAQPTVKPQRLRVLPEPEVLRQGVLSAEDASVVSWLAMTRLVTTR